MVERTLEQHLAACERSAIHLEMRDGYTLDDPLDDRSSWWRPWLQNISENTIYVAMAFTLLHCLTRAPI